MDGSSRDPYETGMGEPRLEIAGWTTERAHSRDGRVTTAEALVQILEALGVTHTFGIVGGGIAPFADALNRSALALWHTRHEAGAAFCATEAYFATRRPTVVFVTTGPGLSNALTGIAAARWDGAKLLVVSGGTSARHRGRWGVQETSSYTTSLELFGAGRLFDYAVALTSTAELPQVARRLATGFARPGGFVAHLNLPLDLQSEQIDVAAPAAFQRMSSGLGHESAAECARHLERGATPIWVGFGAREASREVVELVERTGSVVMCTPRAKGILPETHPQFIGVTGVGGHDEVERLVEARAPDHILVLGSRLGEASSCWARSLIPRRSFLHVDLDPEAFGAAYPDVPTIGIQAEIGGFVRAVLRELAAPSPSVPAEPAIARPLPAPLVARADGPVRPPYLMQLIQTIVVERSDAVVMTESGNAFGWGNYALRFAEPGRYRTSAAYGAMGHFVTGVVGAALARGRKAVAVVGDGAMLMNNEVSTAVEYDAAAVWIVLNDRRYGITHHAMTAQGFSPVATALPATDFVAFARSMGASGIAVHTEVELEHALTRAMAHEGPFVVDVRIDDTIVTPVLARRVQSLKQQGALAPKEVP